MKHHTPLKSFVAFSVWTCLALASLAMSLSAQVTADPAVPEVEQYKRIQFLRDDEVNISDSFTPFGNSLNVAKFGDDGSRVMVDLSGLLLWGNKDGEYTEVPNTELATPLYVTNSELIVWNNRYADFATYPTRPDVDLKLYRIDASGAVVVTDLSVLGKEVLDTSKITTTSGSLVIATTERFEGDRGGIGYDTMTVRFYRVTFSGAVQRIETFNDPEIPVDDVVFDDTQVGPQAEALAYGSDGSVLFEYVGGAGRLPTNESERDYRYIWLNSSGDSKPLDLKSHEAGIKGKVNRVLFVSNDRLVLEEVDEIIYDYRRPGGRIDTNPAVIPVTGDVLSIGDVTITGSDRYFYTHDEADDALRTYVLTDAGATEMGNVTVSIGGAEVIKINSDDGSAILGGSGKLVWVFPNATGPTDPQKFIEIEYSEDASPMFVSEDECLLWDNARVELPRSGVRDQARIVHLVRDKVVQEVERTPLPTNGAYVLDSRHDVIDFKDENLRIYTADKTEPDNAMLRAYLILNSDDGDRLTPDEEDLLDTEPADPDTDKDGLTDGQEVNPYYLVKGTFTWGLAASDAESRGGHLATITDDPHAVLASPEYARVKSALENTKGKLGGNYWIGAQDALIDGTFQWVTGESFGYTNWAVGQPDNINNSDGIELLSDFTWNDAQQDEQKGYILELPATDPNNPDSDGDGLKDGSEVLTYFTDPTNDDTDGDGHTDSWEVTNGTNPLSASDPKFTDSDGDGLTDEEELVPPTGICATNPTNPDSDADGLTDGEERNTYGTNPCNPDSDDDGVDDGDEVTNGTDPLVDSFGGGTDVVIPDYTDAAVYGTYTGLVYEAGNVPVGIITLKVSKKGKFSGRLYGYGAAKSRMKGSFDPLGNYSGDQYNANGLVSNAVMRIKMGSYGYQRVGGTLKTRDDRLQFFNLTRAVYSKVAPTTLSGAYTFITPSAQTNLDTVPAGDGVAYGSVKSDGKVKLKGFSNAGNRYTYSGRVLEGDNLSLFIRPSSGRREFLAGMVKFADLSATDAFGTVRSVLTSAGSGSPYAAGFDESLPFEGSRYVKTGFVQIPADGFDATANNSIAVFTGEIFDGGTDDNYIFTWQSKGKMAAPKVPTYTTKAKMNNKTGMFSGRYVYMNPDLAFVPTKSTLRGVVLQKQDLVSGQAVTNQVTRRYTVIPNESGDVAPSVVVLPRKKKVEAGYITYRVDVSVGNDIPWEVVIPNEFNWVDSNITSGSGNGTVVIFLNENPEVFKPREATIYIAGIEHQIEQSYFGFGGSDGISISPRSKLVSVPYPETYTYEVEVNVPNGTSWRVKIPDSARGWVSADPLEGVNSGTVNITTGSYGPYPVFITGDFREATITIAGKPHDVLQWFVPAVVGGN
ncbi:MAG: hypothetical protein KJO21_08535 [Verrucomicrobiae bacterium]|nr:hypothetical protein [Verrucomicrobiae bacterium]NNJ43520.1 hypothetical protein [Akkermansiaceae bacterium]